MSIDGVKSNLWQLTSTNSLKTACLNKDTQADAVVIGAGFTGVSCALKLAEKGSKVLLLEAEQIGYGGSGRNVGLVNSGLWMPPEKVESVIGQSAGIKLNQLLARGPESVYTNIEKYTIDCELTRTGTLHCAHSKSGLINLKARLRQYKARGTEVELLSKAETENKIGTSAYYGALLLKGAGTIQPLAYINGLAHAALVAGVTIHQNTQVTAVARSNGLWKIRTPTYTIESDAVVIATNAYHQNIRVNTAPTYTPVNYFQVATKPLTEEQFKRILPERQGCWDTAMVMSSIRCDKAGRLIIGSVGSLAQPSATIHFNWAQYKLKKLFPFLTDIEFEHAWHGRIAYSNDHLPHIVAFGPKALTIFGYSGRGIGPGTIFGQAAADYILSDDIDALPIKPEKIYSEKFTKLKGVLYEVGATAFHGTLGKL